MEYDVIVIGLSIGNLLGALNAIRDKKKVAIFEANSCINDVGKYYKSGRFNFYNDIHDLYLRGGNYNINDVLKNLDIPSIKFSNVDSFRIISNDKDVVIHTGVTEFINQIEGMYPGSSKELEEFFSVARECRDAMDYLFKHIYDYDFNKFSDFKNFTKFANVSVSEGLDKLGLSIDVQDILNGMWLLYASTETENSFVEYSVFLLNLLEYGVKVPQEGSFDILASLVDRFLSLGGHIIYNKLIREVLFDGKKISGVVDEAGKIYYTSNVISAVDFDLMCSNMFKESWLSDESKKLANSFNREAKTLTVYFGLNREAKELGLDDYMYFLYNSLNSDAEYNQMTKVDSGDEICIVHNNANSKYSPKGTCVISITGVYFQDALDDFVDLGDYYKSMDNIVSGLIDVMERKLGVNLKDYIEDYYVTSMDNNLKIVRDSLFGPMRGGYNNLLPNLLNYKDEMKIKGLHICTGFMGDLFTYDSSIVKGSMIFKEGVR